MFTDYTSIGAFDVVLQLATSTSLQITWDLMVDADWNLVQYQLIGDTFWQNSTRLPGGATDASVTGLRSGAAYSLRVLTSRVLGAVTRNKRASDADVGISAAVSYATCNEGSMGLNCEQGTRFNSSGPLFITPVSGRFLLTERLISRISIS